MAGGGGNQQTAARGGPMAAQQPPNVYQQSASGLTSAMGGAQAAMNYNPQQVRANGAVGGIGQFMNPYTQEVIGRTGADMMRQGQMQSNQIGAAATQAGAFGGSRHGVAEGTMLGDMNRAFGDIAAQQRQAGFNTALGASQQDVANNLQAQGMNQNAGLNAAQLRLAGAGQMGNLSNMGFSFGQAIDNPQAQQGALMQGMNQQLIDAAKGQWAGFTGAPSQSLATRMAGVGGANFGQGTTTQTQNPGLLNFLSLGVGLI